MLDHESYSFWGGVGITCHNHKTSRDDSFHLENPARNLAIYFPVYAAKNFDDCEHDSVIATAKQGCVYTDSVF